MGCFRRWAVKPDSTWRSQVADRGTLERYGVRLLGTPLSAIKQAEDRSLFRDLLNRIGEPVVESAIITSLDQAFEFAMNVPLPLVIRPAYTLGGTGGGVATTTAELESIVSERPERQSRSTRCFSNGRSWGGRKSSTK